MEKCSIRTSNLDYPWLCMETTRINAEKQKKQEIICDKKIELLTKENAKIHTGQNLKIKCYLRNLKFKIFEFQKQNTVTLHAYYSPQ